ncbi:MAG TPA: MIP/aquaporin family protein [Arenimonas sp.]|nr:MIP/aquaporin family protein [Arenimonas sp.]
MSLRNKVIAEFIGTAALLATVVGSGIMAVNLSQGNNGIALLANAAATAGILYVLISALAPISGAHFNPAVSLVMRACDELDNRELASYLVAQLLGAILGVLLAHAMFEQALIQPGIRIRTGTPQYLSEAVASFGLLMTILLAAKQKSTQIPALVASYIFAAYWFTSSTSFANPAVTIARALTQSFAGIRPEDVAGFIAAQLLGSGLAYLFFRFGFGFTSSSEDSSAR